MGAYATTTSISLILPGFLKEDTTTSDTNGTAIVNKFFDNAEARINACIATRYDISGFTSIPPLLTKLAEDIAIHDVLRATGYRANDRNEYMEDYNVATDTLDKLKEGKAILTYSDGSQVTTRSSGRFLSDKENYTPVFGLDAETEWKRDKDEITDQKDARDT